MNQFSSMPSYVKCNYIIWVVLVAAAVAIFSISFAIEFRDDDLFFKEQLQQVSVIDFMVDQYYSWDGRFMSLNALVQLLMIKYTSAPFAVFVWTCMLLLSVYFMYRILEPEWGNEAEQGNLLKVLLLFCLVWISYSLHLNETLYWATGGIYLMSLALIYGFLFLVYNSHTNGWWNAVGAPLALAVGLSGVTGALPVLVLLSIYLMTGKIERRPRVAFLIWGLLLLGGIIINVVAPGNYHRAALLDTSFEWDIAVMAVNLVKITWRYMVVALPAIAGAVVAGVLFARLHKRQINFSVKYYTDICSLQAFLYRYRWFLAAFSSILPMLMIPDFAGGRTAVYFVSFVFMGIFSAGKGSSTDSYTEIHREAQRCTEKIKHQ